MRKPVEFQKATDVIKEAQSILIITHVSPDGDAIGSALGLGNALSQMDKQVTVAVDEGLPDFFAWLPNAQSIVGELNGGAWDLTISTDASDEARTGEVGKVARANSKQLINLDHHVTNTYFGDIHMVDPDAVSATQIVYEWWQRIGIDWHYDIAQPLLTGLVTDTLGFRTSGTTADALGVAQQLMRYGASLAEATQRTLGVMNTKELLLWKRVLPSVQIHGEVVEATVRAEDMAAVGLEKFEVGQLVGFLRGVNESRIAVVFREDAENDIKISLRSKPGYDVAEVAFALGGGGHKQAAGASLEMTIEQARNKVLPLLQVAAAKGKLEID